MFLLVILTWRDPGSILQKHFMLNHQAGHGIQLGEGLLYYKIVLTNGVNRSLPFQQISKKEYFLSISGIISVYVMLKMQLRIKMSMMNSGLVFWILSNNLYRKHLLQLLKLFVITWH